MIEKKYSRVYSVLLKELFNMRRDIQRQRVFRSGVVVIWKELLKDLKIMFDENQGF